MSSRTCRVFLPLALLLLVATPALAHANLLSADPAPNSRLDESPERVTLNFSERLVQSGSSADIEDEDGNSYLLNLEFPEGNPYRLILHVQPLPDGIYVVRFETLSADDGHPGSGAFLLAVGMDFPDGVVLPNPDGAGTGIRASETVLRAVGYLGTALLLGGLAFLRFQGGLDERVRIVVRKAAVLGAAAATLAATILLAQVIGRTGVGLVATIDSVSYARWTAVRALLLLVATLSAYQVYRAAGPVQGRRDLLSLVAGGLALLAASLASHAAALQGAAAFAVGMHWLHFLSSTVWVGGVVAVLAALWHSDDTVLVRIMRRFSVVATVLVVAVVVTGIYVAGVHLGTFQQLTASTYGALVLAKLGLLVLLVAVATFHRHILVPRMEKGRPGLRRLVVRSVAVEVGLMIAVLAVAGALSHTQPPQGGADGDEHHDHGFPGEVHFFTSDVGHHLHVTILPQPIRVGLQNVTVHLVPLRDAEPTNPNLFLQVTSPDGEEGPARLMQRTGEWSWSLRDSHFTSPGTWQLRIVYQASGDRGDAAIAIGL